MWAASLQLYCNDVIAGTHDARDDLLGDRAQLNSLCEPLGLEPEWVANGLLERLKTLENAA